LSFFVGKLILIIFSELSIRNHFLCFFSGDIFSICIDIDLWLFRRIGYFPLSFFSKSIFDLSSLSFFYINLLIRSFIMLIFLFFSFLNSIYHIDIHYLFAFFLFRLSIFLSLSLFKLSIFNGFFLIS